MASRCINSICRTAALTGCFAFFFIGCASLDPITSQLMLLSTCRDVPMVAPERIVGGQDLSWGDPDQKLVLMLKTEREGRDSVCTGTLISDRVVLTAAHCVVGVRPNMVKSHFITNDDCPLNQVREKIIEVENIVIHRRFDGTPQSVSDLALLYLAEKAPKEQQRVPTIKVGEQITNDKVMLIGFGITGEKMRDSQTLRRIYKSYAKDIEPRGRAFLVDQRRGSGGFCRGDSGAPIIGQLWGEPLVLAVNSANIGLKSNDECQTMSLAIQTLKFSGWIEKNRSILEHSSWLARLLAPEVQRTE